MAALAVCSAVLPSRSAVFSTRSAILDEPSVRCEPCDDVCCGLLLGMLSTPPRTNQTSLQQPCPRESQQNHAHTLEFSVGCGAISRLRCTAAARTHWGDDEWRRSHSS